MHPCGCEKSAKMADFSLMVHAMLGAWTIWTKARAEQRELGN